MDGVQTWTVRDTGAGLCARAAFFIFSPDTRKARESCERASALTVRRRSPRRLISRTGVCATRTQTQAFSPQLSTLFHITRLPRHATIEIRHHGLARL